MVEKRTSEPTLIRVVLGGGDQVYADTLMEILDAQGVEVLRAGDADDRELSGADVLLLEVQDLRVEEQQLLARIRRVAPLMEVVAISAEPVTQNAVRALRSGVFAVLSYPVSAEELLRTVRRACGRKRRAAARMEQLNGGFHRRPAKARSTPSTEDGS